MQAAFSDSAGAIAVPEARAPNARQGQFLRVSSLNILRFGSVLIGAGLLLRVGASEQASSALTQEKVPAQKPVKVRITLPEPAFSPPAKHEVAARSSASLAAIAVAEKAAGVSAHAPRVAATSERARVDAPTPAFAAAFAPIPEASKLQPDKLSADRAAGVRAQPASGPQAVQVAMVPAPHAAPPRAALVAAMPLGSRQSVAEGLLAPIRAASPATGLRVPTPAAPASTPVAIAAAPTKSSLAAKPSPVAAPVLAVAPSPVVKPALAATPAPVVRVAELVKPPVVAAASKPSAGLPQPARIVSPQNLVSAQPRPIAPAAATAVEAPPRQALAAKPIATGPLSPAPVRISLAPPVMRPGPRTTVITSNINDEMRRPASAWDYAEALPPELGGQAAVVARRSASAEPSALPAPAFARPLPVEAASAAPRKTGASAGVPDKSAALAPPAAPAANAKRLAILDTGLDTGRVPERRTLSNVAPSTGAGKRIVLREEDRTAMDSADAANDGALNDAGSAVDGAGEGTTLSLRDSIPHPAF